MSLKRWSTKKRVLVGCLVFVVLFIAVELGEGVRLRRKADRYFRVNTETSTGALLSRRPASFHFLTAPFTIVRMVPNQRFENLNLNRWGYRGRDFDARKPEETRRVVITGGSAGFGSKMYDDEKMFHRLIERSLTDGARRGPELINASIPGYSSEQEMALFAHDLLRFDPDVLVNFTGWNDFYLPHLNDSNRPELPHSHQVLETLMVRGPFQTLIARSLALTGLQRRLHYLARKVGWGSVTPEWSHFPAAVDHFGRNMTTLAALCEGLGIEHLIVLQPEASRKRELCRSERIALDRQGPDYPPAVQQVYEGFRRTAEEVAARFPRTRFVDLSSVFDETQECIWIDFVHFNEMGHEAIAAELHAPIARSLAGARRGGTPDEM